MTIPRLYSSHDAGAVQVNSLLVNQWSSQNPLIAMRAVLLSCLVDGYGDQPPAGWTLVHDFIEYDTHGGVPSFPIIGFTLGNAKGDFFVNFVGMVSGYIPENGDMYWQCIHVYCATSFYGSNGPFMQGANLCSGLYRAGTPLPVGNSRHMFYADHLWRHAEIPSVTWAVVADGNSFCYNSSSSSSSYYYHYSYSYSCGDCLPDLELVNTPQLCLGGSIANYNSYGDNYAYTSGYSMPINPLTGLGEIVEVGAAPYINDRERWNNANSAQVKELVFNSPRLRITHEGKYHYVSGLRGVVYDEALRMTAGWQAYMRALGLPENFALRHQPVTIDGHKYVYAHSYSGASILTDNPAFW